MDWSSSRAPAGDSGGMVVTDDPEITRLCRSMANQGRGEAGVWLSHERLGFNYRMDEMSAAREAVGDPQPRDGGPPEERGRVQAVLHADPPPAVL
ncbi:MAG: DegT/DnrJ/EryC1/StrS family aminotransferase [Bacillota bacterium]